MIFQRSELHIESVLLRLLKVVTENNRATYSTVSEKMLGLRTCVTSFFPHLTSSFMPTVNYHWHTPLHTSILPTFICMPNLLTKHYKNFQLIFDNELYCVIDAHTTCRPCVENPFVPNVSWHKFLKNFFFRIFFFFVCSLN